MKQKHWQVSVFDKTSETIKNDTFYTTDTEAYLIFKLTDEDFTPDSATLEPNCEVSENIYLESEA